MQGLDVEPMRDSNSHAAFVLLVFIMTTNIINFIRRPWQPQLLTSLCGPTSCGSITYGLVAVVQIYIWSIQVVAILFILTVLFIVLRVVIVTGLKAT